MKFFKFSSLFLLLGGIMLTSCSKDETIVEEVCEATSLTETIVGTWNMTGASSTVEFQADGTLLDPDGHLIEGEGSDGNLWEAKSYTVVSDTELKVRADDDNSTNFVAATITINSFTCNQIQANFFTDFTFTRD